MSKGPDRGIAATQCGHRLVSVPLIARLKPNEGGDELQVVLHAVLEFFQQDILIADLAGKFLSLGTFALSHVNKRSNAIFFGAFVILNHSGVDLNESGLRALQLECANRILIGNQRLAERDLRIVLVPERVQYRPAPGPLFPQAPGL